ncbi:MAG: URC4/urg3 family protein [Scytolyngbya sp. HA4215-MV1]|jgi:hypothetical protein|nr:URC4/urg3 family protein [Scytolyngbya sp. HA4215-MV1]
MVEDKQVAAAIAYLRSPQAIRARCEQLLTLACDDRLTYFRCDFNALESVADYVLQVTRSHYPDLQVPFHSRWRHFEVGTYPRLASLEKNLVGFTTLERARTQFDLAITSVLLDAGAGADWRYQEPATGDWFQRSEGLAIASFDTFCQGVFSSQPEHSYQADALGLQQLSETALAQGFQVSTQNPLVGLSGRVELLQRLGAVVARSPALFGTHPARPGHLVDFLLTQAQDGKLAASTVLNAVLTGLGEIWAGRLTLAGANLGDVWVHPALPSDELGSQLVPFHKLSQWLTYSLLEPLQTLGLTIVDLDELTGLPEYRNGGLCLDLGLLQVKDPGILQQRHLPGSEVIVEWRALTVVLLDRIAAQLRQTLNLSAAELPLVKVLQGGTWSAGRQIAAWLRPGGIPPINLESDGTVF